MIETQELDVIKKDVSSVVGLAHKVEIDSQPAYESAAKLLSTVKALGKRIEERKKEITRPMLDALESTRALFRPVEKSYSEAESVVKEKMLEFTIAEQEKQEKEKARIAARVEKGTMREDTAIDKLDNMADVSGKTATSSIRTLTKLRVTDESKIPRKFLVPDMKMIELAIKAGQDVPGVETYQEKVLASR